MNQDSLVEQLKIELESCLPREDDRQVYMLVLKYKDLGVAQASMEATFILFLGKVADTFGMYCDFYSHVSSTLDAIVCATPHKIYCIYEPEYEKPEWAK